MGEFLHRVKFKWEKEVKKTGAIYTGNEKGEIAIRNISLYIHMYVLRLTLQRRNVSVLYKDPDPTAP